MTDKSFKLTEENAKDAPVQNLEWEGKEVETEATPLWNDESGKPIILRVFDFDLPPIKAEELPTTEDLIKFHKTKITGFLWRDELVPVEELKAIYSKDKQHFRIFATCQAKPGSTILERPLNLQKIINANSAKNPN